MNSLQRMVLEYKRLAYKYKSEGAPCEQGEAASRTGCIPASGDGKKKPKAKPTKAGKPKARAKKEPKQPSESKGTEKPTLESIPASKARAIIKDNKNIDKIESAAIQLLGDDWQDKVASIVGAPDDAEIVCSIESYNGFSIQIKHPKIDACTRYLKKNDEGNLILENEGLFLKDNAKGSGLGSEIFSKQVAWAKEHGIKAIICTAGKSDSMNGYYTWPRLGYDCKLTKLIDDDPYGRKTRDVVKEAKSRFPEAEMVLDIMSTPEGREWWKENGIEIKTAIFDLTEGSRSLRVLEAYLEERSKR